MGDTKVRSLPVAPTRRDDSRVEAAPNSEPVQVAKPVSKPATVAPGLTSPIRVGPKPARPTSVPSFPDPLAPRRRSAADFVSSEPLPTLPNLEGLSRKKARIGRKRWLMIGAAALSFAIVGAVAATLLFPSESSQAPSTVAATEAEPVPEPQPAAEHSTSEATAEAAAVAPAPVEPAPVEPAAPAVDTPPASADEAAEAEGTAPAPEPAPVPATLEVEDPQIARARRALEDERPGSAYQVASAAFAERPSKAALLLMVESSCHLGSETRARDAYTKIPLSARPQIRAVCLELGIELGA
jgi:hypothetical protein